MHIETNCTVQDIDKNNENYIINFTKNKKNFPSNQKNYFS